MNAQDQKLISIRKKLNHSVDLAVIQERVIEREKKQYKDTKIYEQVTDTLTF